MRRSDLHFGLAADFGHLFIAHGLRRDELHGRVTHGFQTFDGLRKCGGIEQVVSHGEELRRQLGIFHIVTF
jgi:hypothetical protein